MHYIVVFGGSDQESKARSRKKAPKRRKPLAAAAGVAYLALGPFVLHKLHHWLDARVTQRLPHGLRCNLRPRGGVLIVRLARGHRGSSVRQHESEAVPEG